MPTGADLVTILMSQVGGKYTFGGKVSPMVTNPKARGFGMDCSGFVAWGTGRLGAQLSGGSGQQYAACRHISVTEAIGIPGALLFIPANGAEHVAVSLGDGRTVEAHDTAEGIGVYSAYNRFQAAGLIPGFDYTTPTQGDDDMTPEQVVALEKIETALLDPTTGMLARIAKIEQKLGIV